MPANRTVPFVLSAWLLCAPAIALAEPPPPPHGDAALSAADRHDIVETLSHKLEEMYVFPDRGNALAKQLRERTARGDYDAAKTASAFASALNHDLRELGDDGHFKVSYQPGVDAGGPPPADDAVPTPEELAEMHRDMAAFAYGIPRVERLPGNIGYIDVRVFGPTGAVGNAYDAAFQLLEGSEAVILDLRNNHGGEPESVSYLLSHFFPEAMSDTSTTSMTASPIRPAATGPRRSCHPASPARSRC